MKKIKIDDDLIHQYNNFIKNLKQEISYYYRLRKLLKNELLFSFYSKDNDIKQFIANIEKLESILKELSDISLFDKLYNDIFLEYLKENINRNFDEQTNIYIEFFEENIHNSKMIKELFIEVQDNNFYYPLGRELKFEFELSNFILRLNENLEYTVNNVNEFSKVLVLIEPISQIDGNIVIVGANGSGKSTLSRQLKIGHSKQFTVISAQHFLLLPRESFQIFFDGSEIDVKSYQSKNKLTIDHNDIETNEYIYDFHNIINYLLNNHFSIKGDTYSQYNNSSILEDVIEIFYEVTKKKILIKNATIIFEDENQKTFELNYLSDGERQILYFISNVLIPEQDCYFIIDEPENHLNAQISKTLWDKLEQIKKDSVFIYITHDPDFAASRKNSTLIWSKHYNYPYDWDIEILEENELPEEILVEIIGSKKHILFCEGSYTSIDYELYSSLFGNYKVMPVGGHLNVINYTKAINKLNLHSIEAKGIIDKDFVEDDTILSLKKDKIFVTKFNEIEMLLIDENVLKAVNTALKSYDGNTFNIEEFKHGVFEVYINKKEEVLCNLIKNVVENKISKEKIEKYKSIDDINDFIKQIPTILDIEEIYTKLNLLVDKIYNQKDYVELLAMCNLKNEIVIGYANRKLKRNYLPVAKQQIISNSELRKKIISNYFADIV